MKRIIEYIRQLDRQQLLIYLFSYLIYLGLNKLFSNSILYLLGEESLRQDWTNFSIPCGRNPDQHAHAFVILFQVFKVALFILLVKLSKKRPKGLLSESLIAYFIFDFVYILSYAWDLIPLPISISAWWPLISTGQIFLTRYLPYLELVVAGLWTSALFIFLLYQKRLSLLFLVKRLIIITISVALFYIPMILIWYRH